MDGKRATSSFGFTIKKAGKVTSTGTNVVSKDGKTFTQTLKGTNASGQPTSSVAVFEKQWDAASDGACVDGQWQAGWRTAVPRNREAAQACCHLS